MPIKKEAPKKVINKISDAEKVNDYMSKLEHPLKAEIEAVRIIIKASNPKINERIKWNAPSYYYKQDLVTFAPRTARGVHLVFHHPLIVAIQSPLLEGHYKDRRMMYLHYMAEVKEHEKALQTIMNSLVEMIDNQTIN